MNLTDNLGGSTANALGGLTPLGMIQGGIDGMTQIGETLMKGNFDYGQANYSIADAKKFGAERGKGIGEGISKSIPLVGKMLAGPFGMIGQAIAAKIAENRARPVIENREAKMDSLVDAQREKIRENRFFRESDLNYGKDGSRFY